MNEHAKYTVGASGTAIVARGKVSKILKKFVDEGSRILDIASAGGELGRQLEDTYDVVSADIEDFTGGLPFVKIDANSPWPIDEKFDAVVSVATIEHLESPAFFLREIRSHLKPEGVCFVSFPDVTDWRHRFRFLYNAELSRYEFNKEHITVIHPTTFERIFPFKIIAKGVSFRSAWYVGKNMGEHKQLI